MIEVRHTFGLIENNVYMKLASRIKVEATIMKSKKSKQEVLISNGLTNNRSSSVSMEAPHHRWADGGP